MFSLLFLQQGEKQLSLSTTPDLFESLDKLEMWALIQRPGTRLTISMGDNDIVIGSRRG